MRFRTLEIRWHDSKPIASCDFQPVAFKKARATHSYRLATAGEDNHVRIWMVHPNLRPPVHPDPTATARPPRVEYLATLSRHSAAVNVVRFSPNGELIASAGDDGMVIIWAPSATPQSSTYGTDLTPEEMQLEKEYWKPRTTFRCTTMQVYDLAWSPTGEYIVAGSTDNTARVFTSTDGKCIHEIAEHTHFVQGVAWDPLNEYIATQSSDRSMHIYRITPKPTPPHHLPPSGLPHPPAAFELHAVGRNTKMPHRHSRTPSAHGQGVGRPRMFRRASTASDVESALLTDAEDSQPPSQSMGGGSSALQTPLTPAMSVVGGQPTPSSTFMFPPPPIDSSSRRSSFSGSNAPGSPSSTFSTPSLPPSSRFDSGNANPNSSSNSNNNNNAATSSTTPNTTHTRYGRSPSPMPPLPAIRSLPSPSSAHSTAMARAAQWANVRLYGDESYTNFFRRLGFSPDGGLLLTPAGQFEDPAVVVVSGGGEGTPVRGRRGHPSEAEGLFGSAGGEREKGSASSVYVYSRANFGRPPVAQLPGHKKASVAVRFSPVLYELRQGVGAPGVGRDEEEQGEKKTPAVGVLEKGVDGQIEVDVVGPVSGLAGEQHLGHPVTPQKGTTTSASSSTFGTGIATPSPRPTTLTLSTGFAATTTMPSPGLSPMDLRPATPLGVSKPATPVPSSSSGYLMVPPPAGASVFALPYRMLFAVVTMDTVAIYDTQQAGPVCMLTKLHYDEFTDMSWSPDGQCLMLSSRDGYCTMVMFDEPLPAHHTQQQTLQFQSIAQHHSVPLTVSSSLGGAYHAPTSSSSSASASSSSIGGTQVTPASTPLSGTVGLPGAGMKKRAVEKVGEGQVQQQQQQPPLTPAASVDGSVGETAGAEGGAEPPKKKRRVALVRVGDLD